MGEQLASLILGVEIGHRELDRLAFRQRFAEGHALLRVFADHLEAALRHAESMGRLMHAVARYPGLRLAHPVALFADQFSTGTFTSSSAIS